MNLREIGCRGVDWFHLAQDRDQWWALVNTVMDFQVPFKVGNFLGSQAIISFSRRTMLHGVYVQSFCTVSYFFKTSKV
jgi:hypothetical protein